MRIVNGSCNEVEFFKISYNIKVLIEEFESKAKSSSQSNVYQAHKLGNLRARCLMLQFIFTSALSFVKIKQYWHE